MTDPTTTTPSQDTEETADDAARLRDELAAARATIRQHEAEWAHLRQGPGLADTEQQAGASVPVPRAQVAPSQGQDIPAGQLDALIADLPRPADGWTGLAREMLREAARQAYRVGYAAALGCPISVAPSGYGLRVGDRPEQADPDPAAAEDQGQRQRRRIQLAPRVRAALVAAGELGLGAPYPARPRPLPDRSAWALSAPAPDGGRLRQTAAADPGIATYPHAERSPVRQPQWAAARAADRATASGVGPTDHGPEIAAEPARPGDTPGELTPERGPIHPIRLDDPAPLEPPTGDPGADLDQLVRTALASERPLGIHPAPRSPVDPGPHPEEPATPRWRWWRALTSWRARDRKPKE